MTKSVTPVNLSMGESKAPLIVHIIHRLSVGGLENGLINLINHMPADRYRHAIVCLSDSTDFSNRIQGKDVPVLALCKREGRDLSVHARFWKVLNDLRPNIVHTRNLPGLEFVLTAALAGIPVRIHGEHGRDIYDLDGLSLKYNLLRKAIRPLIHQYIAVSSDLSNWLANTVGIRRKKIAQIYNGVDLNRFFPQNGSKATIGPPGFVSPRSFVVGTVGRLEVVKDQLTMVKAFLYLLDGDPDLRKYLRLVIVGDGSLRERALRLLKEAKAENLSWLPGERDDIPRIMQGLDLFVLPSLREGISNTILEAMACGLPVVATRVGGNPELVEEGVTGMLVPPSDPVSMANAILSYFKVPAKLRNHGEASRKRAETHFSMEKMVNGYMAVYDRVLSQKRR